MLGQAPARVAMMVIYHHHRHLLRMSSSCNFWEIRELWKRQCASLRRTPLRPTSNIKGLNQISIAHSKTSKTLKPPIFKEVEELLQADEWLNTIEQKFRLLRVTKHLKAEYVSHQL